jgi:hypothetical protein
MTMGIAPVADRGPGSPSSGIHAVNRARELPEQLPQLAALRYRRARPEAVV